MNDTQSVSVDPAGQIIIYGKDNGVIAHIIIPRETSVAIARLVLAFADPKAFVEPSHPED